MAWSLAQHGVNAALWAFGATLIIPRLTSLNVPVPVATAATALLYSYAVDYFVTV
jgi:hypothetical protein